MKQLINSFIVGIFILLCSISNAEESAWLNDFSKAKTQAENKNLPIIVNFSGSDWCYWCKKLDEEIFSQKPFLNFASNHLVLFQADFPRSKRL
ncbi:MAG: thioredoxin family protein, partial [Candidatus Theseobacter exili]|nr:thioredoxin family protein [Candidatus Theseobacter exili]